MTSHAPSAARPGRRTAWPLHALLILASLVTIGPFLWMILTSFKTFEESILIPPTILPASWNLDNYQVVLGKFPFGAFYLNTFGMVAMRSSDSFSSARWPPTRSRG